MMDTVQLVLDEVFQEKVGLINNQLETIGTIYDLPHLNYRENTGKDTYEYIKNKPGFVILILYTNEGRVYFENDGTAWSLPGGSMYKNENINDVVKRVTKNVSLEMDIGSVEPILLVDNIFSYKESSHTLKGIVYSARINNVNCLANIKTGLCIQLTDSFIEKIQKYGNKEIISYFHQHILADIIELSNDDLQYDEINTNYIMKGRYAIHRMFMKPLLSIFGLNKNSCIKKWIYEQASLSESIIDISCGDDALIYKLSEKPKDLSNRLVVGNDISWSQIEGIGKEVPNILFTNHSAGNLPFRDKIFDVGICKNTMHHMVNRDQLLSMLRSLKRIAKKIIIVEIENPQEGKRFAKLLHKYRYRLFLKDVGNAYLNKTQILEILQYVFREDYEIDHGTFATGQGSYFYSSISPIYPLSKTLGIVN